MTDKQTILDVYIRERRALSFAGFRREDLGHVVRQTPNEGKGGGWVYFPDFKEQEAEEVIKEQIAYFQAQNLEFEWKVYDFDRPRSLSEHLVRLGFQQGEPEHLMVYDLDQHQPSSVKSLSNINISHVETNADIQLMRQLQEGIWDKDLEWLFHYIANNADIFSCYIAKEGKEVVGSGWTEYLPGSEFPELHGGGVIPRLRKKGVYSALLAKRFEEAISKGYRYLTVDAAPMSKPILERKGFVSLAVTWPYTLMT